MYMAEILTMTKKEKDDLRILERRILKKMWSN